MLKPIIKSEYDKRNYEWLELDNKLKVIIITDEESKECGALLNINVGSVHDTLPGMAHFLEHMVFMGSSKYPEENNFMDSVISNGGKTNAFTADDHTSYYFSIDSNKFINILDMFAWFFIDPLLRKDGINREVNAVDSEAKKNLLDDMWIYHEIIKKTFIQDHPINHFTCGNKDTLECDNLRELVKEFFEKYYSSNIMHLILFINSDIDKTKLIDQVTNTFGKIKNRDIDIDNKFGKMLIPGNLVKYIPNKDIDSLSICFEVPNLTSDFTKSPFYLFESILSSKSENSLFKIYENFGFIIESSIQEGYFYNDYIVYVYKIILTESGNKRDNIIKIIEIFFTYIKSILKSDKLKSIYDTQLIKDKKSFNIIENSDIISTMMEFNILLIRNVEPENLLNFNLIRPDYNNIKNYILDFLKNIKIYNSSIVYSSRNTKLNNTKIDDIFRIKYSINKLEPVNISSKLYDIIDKNKFITSDFNIIQDIKDNYPLTNPEKIDNKYNLIYNFNSSFKVPFVNIYIQLEFPNLFDSPEVYMKTMLYLETIYSDNANIITELEYANYDISMTLEFNILLIYIKGDNNKIFEIVDIFNNIFSDKSIGTGFNNTKQKLYKSYNGFENEQPITKVSKLINKLLYVKYFTPYDLLKVLQENNNLTFDSCKETYNKVKNNVKTNILVSGNINKSDAITLCDKVYNNFNITNEITTKNTNIKDIKFPFIQKYKNKNKKEKNNIFNLYFEITRYIKGVDDWSINIAFVNILNNITDMLYFNELRTKEQLGYIVKTKVSQYGFNNYKILTIRFLVQSPIKDSEYLYKRTQDFIKKTLLTTITKMTQEEFNNYKKGVIIELTKPFNNLSQLELYLCTQIFDGSYEYNYREKVVDSLNSMTIDDFKELFKTKILNNNNIYTISIDSNI